MADQCNNICRLCRSVTGPFTCLFLPENKLELVDLILQYLFIEIKENDYLSHQICSKCIERLNGVVSFVQECHNNQEIAHNSIKTENLEEFNSHDLEVTISIKEECLITKEKQAANLKKKGKKLQCPLCTKCFTSEKRLLNHQELHGIELQKCSECPRTFKNEDNLKKHLVTHQPSSCDMCEKTFKSQDDLRHHQRRIHLPMYLKYKYHCDQCGQSFTNKSNLNCHKRLHTGIKPFSCEICEKSFNQKSAMMEHQRVHSGDKPFQCSICPNKFASRKGLEEHIMRHNGEKPHQCKFCGKTFLGKGVLLRHEYVHTDTKPYPCRYCPKAFRDSGKRKVHERLHTGERPYQCDVCGKGFTETGNLKKHKKVHDKDPNILMDQPDFQSPYNNESYSIIKSIFN